MTSAAVSDLAAHGVSVWLDDLSRERLSTGNSRTRFNQLGIREFFLKHP